MRGRKLNADRLAQAERLLRANVDHEEIARRLRVSRWTISRVAAGKHPLQLNPTHVRCTGCRALVAMPCVLCGLGLSPLPAAG